MTFPAGASKICNASAMSVTFSARSTLASKKKKKTRARTPRVPSFPRSRASQPFGITSRRPLCNKSCIVFKFQLNQDRKATASLSSTLNHTDMLKQRDAQLSTHPSSALEGEVLKKLVGAAMSWRILASLARQLSCKGYLTSMLTRRNSRTNRRTSEHLAGQLVGRLLN